jgi:hypothetical protein
MNCQELLRRLGEYGEANLSPDLCSAIERHLSECEPCEELRRDLMDLSRLCQQAQSARLPDTLRRRLERLLQR